MIVALCNPYHSKYRYNGEEVLQYDGTTPVKWIIEDGLTESEAVEHIWKMAIEECDTHFDIRHEDKIGIDALLEIMVADWDMIEEEAKEELSWFKGEGIYYDTSDEPMILKGEKSYCYDAMTYRIEDKNQ